LKSQTFASPTLEARGFATQLAAQRLAPVFGLQSAQSVLLQDMLSGVFQLPEAVQDFHKSECHLLNEKAGAHCTRFFRILFLGQFTRAEQDLLNFNFNFNFSSKDLLHH